MVVYLNDETAKRLKAEAERQKRNVSQVVEVLLDEHQKKSSK